MVVPFSLSTTTLKNGAKDSCLLLIEERYTHESCIMHIYTRTYVRVYMRKCVQRVHDVKYDIKNILLVMFVDTLVIARHLFRQ